MDVGGMPLPHTHTRIPPCFYMLLTWHVTSNTTHTRACTCEQAVADIIRTTLGPRAMLKMLLGACVIILFVAYLFLHLEARETLGPCVRTSRV